MTDELDKRQAEWEERRQRKWREVCEAEERQKEADREELLKNAVSARGTMKSNIEAGDRKAMLELLTTVADSLRAFDTLPQEARESLADCLQAMRNNLAAAGFSRKPGEKKTKAKGYQEELADYLTALEVDTLIRFGSYPFWEVPPYKTGPIAGSEQIWTEY